MGKLLLIAIAIWLIIVILKRYRTSMQRPSAPDVEDMVQCATCGLHLPKHDSLSRNDKYYCSSAHLEKRHEQ